MAKLNREYDVIIIGGGPGGYVAAIKASQLGMTVALIEKDKLGGVCLNWGCIPTKALLKSAEVKHLFENASDFGISVTGLKIDFQSIIDRSRKVSKQLSMGVEHLMKKNKIDVYRGIGKINKNNEKKIVEILDNENKSVKDLHSENIIIATGASSKNLPFVKANNNSIWDYKSAMIPDKLPKSIIIIGSGAIGCEFASFYNDLGSDVTIVEMQPRILPNEDHEVSDFISKSFNSRGIKILTNTQLKEVIDTNSIECKLQVDGKNKSIDSEKLILAVGIMPNISNLGLENFKIKITDGYIETDKWMETKEKGIFAIGDVTSGPWLAHKASHEGVVCVEKINGINKHGIKKEEIPGCTYCRPQVASIGMTESYAVEKGYEIKVGKFPFIGNGKAIAIGENEGFVKTIFDKKSGELLGAHMVGPEVTELIQGFAIAKRLETTEAELMTTIFPHPTLSESMHESVLDAYGKVIHY